MRIFIATMVTILLAGGMLSAQQAIRRADVISYQGMVTGSDGGPVADGEYSITVTLYGDEAGTTKVWQDTYTTAVHGGIFNIYLGSGTAALPAPGQMDRSLWIGTRIADGDEMRPLARLSSSPYAMNVPDNAITTSKLADGAVTADKINLDYISGLSVNGKKIVIDGKVLNIQAGKDIDINYDEVTKSLVIGTRTDARAGGEKQGKDRSVQATPQDAWSMRGNGVNVPGAGPIIPINTDYIGTNNVMDFNIKVNIIQAMRYQSNGGQTPTIIGGPLGNTATAAGVGNIIAGGGGPALFHRIDGIQYNVISGGADNSILNVNSAFGVIAGGQENTIGGAALVGYGVIGGGLLNQVTATYGTIGGGNRSVVSAVNSTVGGGIGNLVSGTEATIGGGDGNQVSRRDGAIAGGYHNQITGGADYGTVAGGNTNVVSAQYGTIGGGQDNSITADYGFVGGGQTNTITGQWGVINGGLGNNIVNTGSAFGVIAGGQWNTIGTAAGLVGYGVIGGGLQNQVTATYGTIGGGNRSVVSAVNSTVGGGIGNLVSGTEATIAGGDGNQITRRDGALGGGYHNQIISSADYGTIAGGSVNTVNAAYGAIGGGANHSIVNASSSYGTIAGGDNNVIGTAAAAAVHATIGGGQGNLITADNGFVGGGQTNTIAGLWGVIDGGLGNNIVNAGSAFGVIAGGQWNTIGTAAGLVGYGVIGGGLQNQVTATYGTIAGGNRSVVSAVNSTVGGGIGNLVSGSEGTIAGGDGNQTTTTDAAIGGGHHNSVIGNGIAGTIPGGDMLTAQSYGQAVVGVLNIPKGSTLPGGALSNEPLFIVGNGLSGTPSNAFEVSYNGHSTVFHNTAGATPVITGSTYTDNVVYAWGNIDQKGNPICSPFGVSQVKQLGTGWYQVTMDIIDPDGNPVLINCGSVTATIASLSGPGSGKGSCSIISVSQIVNNVFDVYIVDRGCSPTDEPFMFKVTGRP